MPDDTDPLSIFRNALLADPDLRPHTAQVYRVELAVRERIGGANLYVRKPNQWGRAVRYGLALASGASLAAAAQAAGVGPRHARRLAKRRW